MSSTQSTDSLRELNAKLLAEIAKLRKKFAEIKDENAKISELRRKVAESLTRLAIVEQSSVAVDRQSKNNKKTIAKQSAPSSCIYPNVEIKDQSLPSCMSNQKSSEDRKMDTFLDNAHKKSVSNGIRQPDGIKDATQSNDKTIPYDMISAKFSDPL
ncbi:hypothetical protein C1645_821065 [Glomus cerebriforme]|uniref:Shugoshin C-terminal domain-containing protein n=1 Tax=Glomus cerebriforme TaxID=658196 RepID=A0A397T4B6_9GLOM|nr:hypothetical protein C1645_821065 [Glomus cerebriforme]